MKAHLTDMTVQRLKPGTYFDDMTPAFGIRVGKNRKTWIVMRGVKRQRITVGHYPTTSLSEARQKAKKLLAEDTEETISTLTFKEAVDRYLEKHSQHHHRPTTQYEIKRQLDARFVPTLGKKRLSAITTTDITNITDGIAKTPSEALHAFRAVRGMLRWSVGRRYLNRSPLQDVAPPSKDKVRQRTLSDEELKKVWNACEGSFGNIVKLLILTGARKTEISSLRWEWIDEGVITLPSTLTKNGQAHHIPLASLAETIIEQIPHTSDFLFPGKSVKTHFNDGSWGKLKRALDKSSGVSDWHIHDLRRTFATGLASLGVRLEVTERLLNHISNTQGGIVGVYQRYDFWAEKVEAIALWNDKLTALIAAH